MYQQSGRRARRTKSSGPRGLQLDFYCYILFDLVKTPCVIIKSNNLLAKTAQLQDSSASINHSRPIKGILGWWWWDPHKNRYSQNEEGSAAIYISRSGNNFGQDMTKTESTALGFNLSFSGWQQFWARHDKNSKYSIGHQFIFLWAATTSGKT